MLRVILVDDEKLALDELGFMLSSYPEIKVIGAYTNPAEALGQIIAQKPDLIFLDIDMPVINGLTLAKEVISVLKNTEIVFVTAFDGYAVNAFEVNAMDYLLKPVSRDRLDKTIERLCLKHKANGKVGKYIMDKLNNIEKSLRQFEEKLAVWENEQIYLLKPSDILYLTVEDGNVLVFARQGRFLSKLSLEIWEGKLAAHNFFRCHRSFLVNVDFIERIIPTENNCCTIMLNDRKDEIPVSRRQTKELRTKLEI